MKILAVDCTAKPASVAILEDGKVLSSAYTNTGLTHSQTLVPMVDSALKNAQLTLDGIEYYIVAYDTYNSIAKGSATTPYTIIIKDASSISRLGDVDGDGTITTKDALMLMQAINEERILNDDEFKRADLNKDGVLSSMEALRILQYINGNVNTLEM